MYMTIMDSNDDGIKGKLSYKDNTGFLQREYGVQAFLKGPFLLGGQRQY